MSKPLKALIGPSKYRNWIGKTVTSHEIEYLITDISFDGENSRERITLLRTDGTYQKRYLTFSQFNELIDRR